MTDLQTLSHLREEMWFAVLSVAAVALTLRVVRRKERGALRFVWGISLLSVLAMAIATHFQSHTRIALSAMAAALGFCGIAFFYFIVRGFFRIFLPAIGLRVPRIADDLTLACLLLGWTMVVLRLLGVELSQLLATSAVITAVIAFSMQDTLGNVLGGVALQLDNSLSVGDWVRLDDISGCVTDVHWRYARIETSSHDLIVIPNSWLMRNRFTVSRRVGGVSRSLSRVIYFNIDADTNPEIIVATLESSIVDAEISNVLKHPGPKATFCDVSAGHCKYALRYWLDDQHRGESVDSAVRTHAFVALARAGIRRKIPKDGTDNWRATEERKEFEKRLEAICKADLFSTLSKQEQESLASCLIHRPYVTGDIIARQGDVANSVYIITQGAVEVFVNGVSERLLVATLPAGTIFGEMSLLTGEPRTATVIAATPTECYQLDKEGLAHTLKQRPEIAKQLTSIINSRKEARDVVLRQADQVDTQESDLLDRVLKFFNL